MKKAVLALLLALLTLAGVVGAQPVAAPAAPASPAIEALAGQAVSADSAFELLLAGQFEPGLVAMQQALRDEPGNLRARQAVDMVNDYLADHREDELQRSGELDKAIRRVKSLLEIARLGENNKGAYAEARKTLEAIREIIIDLLAAPKIEENITGDNWMSDRIARDRVAINDHDKRLLTLLDGDQGRHAAAVREGLREFWEAFDRYAEAAAARDFSDVKHAADSLESLEDIATDLAMAMDDLMALVSEMPWSDALERLRLVRTIAWDDATILDRPWARDIVAGAEQQARAYSADGNYYKALNLYSLLDDIYAVDNDIRYRDDINRVTRQAVMMSLYAVPDPKHYGDDESGRERYEKALDSYEQDWRDHIRGVDFFMVRMAMARINDYYVESPDFVDLLDGALDSLRMLVQIPRTDMTFPGLAKAEAREAFLAELDAIAAQAREAGVLDYRMVNRSLGRILWVNRRTVELPDEVIDVEFANGLLHRLDRFTIMIWPNEWKEFRKQITGNFKGVGIQIQFQRETDYIGVISPLENSPAFRAGIQADDQIVKIDGEDAKGIDTDEAVERITGPAGTKVILTIKRPGLDEPLDFELTREEINVQTVKGWKRTSGGDWDWMIDPEGKIGYVRITSFTEDTVPGLRRAIGELRSAGVRGVVLDMRGNPGGMFTAAVGVVDEFVREGAIVSTRGRRPEDAHAAMIPGGFEDGPLVVLIDQNSASAAEIVSGALKDLGRATIVGRRSFGKGSVQNLVPIRPDPIGDNEAHLKITTAYYYLPSGRCLHRKDDSVVWGVDPDIESAVTPRQARRWLMYRNRTDVIKNWDAERLAGDMADQLRADIQLECAVLVCRLKALAEAPSEELHLAAAPATGDSAAKD